MIAKGKVLPGKLLAKELEKKEEVTESGLVLISKNPNPDTLAKVVLVGDKAEKSVSFAEVGKTIIFTPLSAQKVHIDGEEFLLLEQTKILFMYD